jgi:hypothetical protein
LPVHGATSRGWLSPRGRVLSRTGLGVLSWVIAPELVDEAVGDGLAWEMRLRALPSRLGVYFILGLCLYSGELYAQVLRELTSGLGAALAAACCPGWPPWSHIGGLLVAAWDGLHHSMPGNSGACQAVCVSLGGLQPFRYFNSRRILPGYRGTRPGNWTANAFSAAFQPIVPVPRSPLSRTRPSPSI